MSLCFCQLKFCLGLVLVKKSGNSCSLPCLVSIVEISVYTCCLLYVLACGFLRVEPRSLVMPLPGSVPHLEWVLNKCLWDE